VGGVTQSVVLTLRGSDLDSAKLGTAFTNYGLLTVDDSRRRRSAPRKIELQPVNPLPDPQT